ncbi:MAG: outer membrane beta-barrel protein [Bradyrhizobiaceae bacterium]|nr:outer membrane beta-barrel protein [Bradyrhizobiaceae bacterium]
MPRLPPISCARAGLALAPIACAAALWPGLAAPQDFGLRPTLAAASNSQSVYGSPPGSGAGETGFVSTNIGKKAGKRSAKKLVSASPLAGTSAALRGAPDGEPTGSIRRKPARRAVEEEPYAPVGLRIGSFDVKPSAEVSYGYDDNPFRIAGGRGSRFALVAAKVETRSNWSRHELAGELRGAFTDYLQVSGNDRPEAEAKLRGRIDVTAASRIELDARAALTTEPAGSPDAVTTAKRPPNIYTFGGNAGYVQQFNRLELGLRGSVERSIYQDAELLSGGILDLSDRNYTAYGVALRGSYEVTPGIKPFVEAGVDRRVFDHEVDFMGVRRGSDGLRARAGWQFARERLLTGEISAGFATRHYKDPALDDISGLIFDASLVWTASALTKVTLKANSEIGETTLPGASGVFQRQASIEIEHAFRRWLIGTASVTYGQDDYRGAGRRDDKLTLAASLSYFLNRQAALKGEVRREDLRSTAAGQDYTANIVMVGLRLQR